LREGGVQRRGGGELTPQTWPPTVKLVGRMTGQQRNRGEAAVAFLLLLLLLPPPPLASKRAGGLAV
jgi:hypothetical protein